MRLAVIPARGGSKRIARKNIREFCGKPILAYSIEAALTCAAIDAVWVSTDDPEIAATAQTFGADVPFVRPSALSDDHTIMQAVMAHALKHAEQENIHVSAGCLLFATAPFVSAHDLMRGWESLSKAETDFALSVTPFRTAPQRSQRVNNAGFLCYTSPEYCNVRSQDLEPLYHDAAHFVWGKTQAFLNAAVTSANIAPVVIPAAQVIDIDTPADWAFAELLYRAHASLGDRRAA